VGLIFPEEADDSVYELLEDILQGIVTRTTAEVKRHAQQGDVGYSYSISRGIVTGIAEVDLSVVESNLFFSVGMVSARSPPAIFLSFLNGPVKLL
jgi:hypothetical protein